MARLLLVLLLGLLAFSPAAAQVRLEGLVVDRTTGVPVAQVHVQDEDGGRGSVTNENGRFRLEVEKLPVTLTFRHISYAVQRVAVREPGEITVRLVPAQITLGELLVVGEDFAPSLMERVIRRKRQMRQNLETVASAGYTRLLLEKQGEIVLMSEAVFDAYWDARRGIREVIRSRRESADFYATFGFEATGPVPNFYDDRIALGGLDFIGPTHPDALKHYVFTLARRREAGAQTIYDLYITPRAETENTLIGTLSVLDGADVLLYADLRPARHVVFPPPVLAWQMGYQQQFGPAADSTLWWPLDLHAEGRVTVADGARDERTAFASLTARLSDVQVNVPLPAEPYQSPDRVQVDVNSVMDDQLFYRGEGIVPLSPREIEALGRLQGFPLTLAEAFPAEAQGGFLNAFRGYRAGEPPWTWPEVFGVRFRTRYNRVDGVFRGVGQTYGAGDKQLEVRAGQRSSRGRLTYYARLRRPLGPLYVEGLYDDDTFAQLHGSRYPDVLASIPALAGSSYFDYGIRVRYAMTLGVEKVRWQAALTGAHDVYRSTDRLLRSGVVGRFDPNPALDAGRFNRLRAAARYATPPASRALDASAEADVIHAGSPGTSARVGVRLDVQVPTFAARRFDPNTLRVRLAGGVSGGTLPVQERWALDGQLAGFAPFGVLHGRLARPYAGDAYAALFWQHDFRTRPFEILHLWPLVGAGTGLRLRGAHGRTWQEGAPAMPWHHEIGLDATRLFATPLRVGLTRRLDAPGWYGAFGFDVRW